jgi:hypothetical protein
MVQAILGFCPRRPDDPFIEESYVYLQGGGALRRCVYWNRHVKEAHLTAAFRSLTLCSSSLTLQHHSNLRPNQFTLYEVRLDLGAGVIVVNRRGSQLKCLYLDRCGFCIWGKRLETAKFIGDWRAVRTREMDWTS